MTKNKTCLVIVLAVLSMILTGGLAAAVSPPMEGGTFPDIRFPIPEDKAHRDYLGLQGSGEFTVPQIKAPVVIIEVFNMY